MRATAGPHLEANPHGHHDDVVEDEEEHHQIPLHLCAPNGAGVTRQRAKTRAMRDVAPRVCVSVSRAAPGCATH